MKLRVISVAALLILAMATGAAAISMPSLLGKTIVPQMFDQSSVQLPSATITPAEVAAQATDETFTARVSGNVYFDKLPVEGADVVIYLNGCKVGETTAGDIYIFEVPGVRKGDTIRVDATYEGFTGTASEVVKFQSISMDVNIKSGRSFIRDALELLPTRDELNSQQSTASSSTPSSSSTGSGSSTGTSSADTNSLTSQIFGDTASQLGKTISTAGSAPADATALTSTPDTGANMNIGDIQNTINAGNIPGQTV